MAFYLKQEKFRINPKAQENATGKGDTCHKNIWEERVGETATIC